MGLMNKCDLLVLVVARFNEVATVVNGLVRLPEVSGGGQ